MARKKNYLNNRDMLKEIHKSKMTYCSFLDFDNDNQEDYIVDDVQDINGTQNVQVGKDDEGEPIMGDVLVINLAKEARAKRLNRLYDTKLTKDDIKSTDLVFRVMTSEHVPLVPKHKQKKKKDKKKEVIGEFFDEVKVKTKKLVNVDVDPTIIMVPMKCKFPPFYHYRIDENEVPFVVGKSHWKGTVEDGVFCMEHGRTNENLAKMQIKICERYGTRGNWRGYCVDKDTEALTQRGWLSGAEINENDIILSYNDGFMKWSNIKSIYRGEYDGLMHKLTVRGMDSLITPDHKIVTARGLIKVEHLLESDKVILMGKAVRSNTTKKYSNSLVELIGWIITEGVFQYKRGSITEGSIQIYQNEGLHAERIRNCLNKLNYTFTEGQPKPCISFNIWRKSAKNIFKILHTKNLNMNFILSLTPKQRLLLIDTMIAGDGWQRGNNRSYCQKDISHSKLFQALCAIAGIKTNLHYTDIISYGKDTFIHTINLFSKRGNSTRGECINMHGGKRSGKRSGKIKGRGKASHPNEPTTYYKGTVWCPETEYGSFLARRNGKVYLTGNTYNDEMQGQALVQLSSVGLKFNEAKSQNPFAYYTAIINNAFTSILNSEKTVQNIRDDILEANNLTPSWSRQFANDNSDQKYLDNPDD